MERKREVINMHALKKLKEEQKWNAGKGDSPEPDGGCKCKNHCRPGNITDACGLGELH